MDALYFVLLVLAGVCFGLAAGHVAWRKVDFLATGLFFWVLVPLIQHFNKLG